MRIAIVGAGIAGLTVALALRRRGIACRIYEQAHTLVPIGAGIQLAPNAVRLLDRLGLAERLHVVAAQPLAAERRRWQDGAVLTRTALHPDCIQLFGAPYYTVHRADLQSVLRKAVDADQLRLGSRCVRLTSAADQIQLDFADGSVAVADAVIGADGMHSVVRQELAADQPRFSGQVMYRAVLPTARTPFAPELTDIRSWMGPNQHCVCYPVARGELVSFSASAPAADKPAESWSSEASVHQLANAYADWHEDVLRLFRAAERIGCWALYDRDPLPVWGQDRLTLVGDAAHPMLPTLAQGANQAIEDALVLATFLSVARRPEDLPGALRSYENARRERADRIQLGSRARSSQVHMPDGTAQRARDARLRGGGELAERAWIYGYDAELAASGGRGASTHG